MSIDRSKPLDPNALYSQFHTHRAEIRPQQAVQTHTNKAMTWNFYNNGVEEIPYRTQDELQNILNGKTEQTTSKPLNTQNAKTSASNPCIFPMNDGNEYAKLVDQSQVLQDGKSSNLRYEQQSWSSLEDRAFAEAKKTKKRVTYIGHDGFKRTMTDKGNIIVASDDLPKILDAEKRRLASLNSSMSNPNNLPAVIVKNVKNPDNLPVPVPKHVPAPVPKPTPKILPKPNNIDWKKFGKIGLGIAAVGGLIGLGIWAYNKLKDKNTEATANKQGDSNTVVVPPTDNAQDSTVIVVPPENDSNLVVAPVIPTEPEVVPVIEETEDPSTVTPSLPLNEDGTYITQKGDCFWNIAKKHLEDKYKDEPEKYANKTQREKDAMIQLETRRIMKLNGYTLAENKWSANPTLHPRVNIKIVEKDLDKVA